MAGSDDPALQIVLDRVGRQVITVGARGSFQGVRALARGDADGAAIHLLHRNGIYNAPFASALLRGHGPVAVFSVRTAILISVIPGLLAAH